MTTILVDTEKRKVYSDTRATCFFGKKQKNVFYERIADKVMKISKGTCTIACCGSCGLVNAFLNTIKIKSKMNGNYYSGDTGTMVFLNSYNNQCLIVSVKATLLGIKIVRHEYHHNKNSISISMGSGGKIASKVFKQTKNALKAMGLSAMTDSGTGCEVIVTNY